MLEYDAGIKDGSAAFREQEHKEGVSSKKSVQSRDPIIRWNSEPFDPEELDLDLPQFNTKYLSFSWKLYHSLLYCFYSLLLFGANIWYIISENFISYNLFSLFSHISYFFSTFMEWFYFKRGCIGKAN